MNTRTLFRELKHLMIQALGDAEPDRLSAIEQVLVGSKAALLEIVDARCSGGMNRQEFETELEDELAQVTHSLKFQHGFCPVRLTQAMEQARLFLLSKVPVDLQA